MDQTLRKFDKLHRKHNPGFSFPQSHRQLNFPNVSQFLCDSDMSYHCSSKTQKVYSPFQNNYYLPPHLNSSKSHGLISKGECKGWEIKKSNMPQQRKENWKKKEIVGRHIWNRTTNYDIQYRAYEERVKGLPGRKYELIEPRIKYLIDQDRPGKSSNRVEQEDWEDK